MAIHFFTELGPELQQAANQNFGALSSSEYQLSSLHSWDGAEHPNAYASIGGLIRYQKDTETLDPDLVNAIIQVTAPTELRDLPVKYLIYRGIRKDSLLQADGKFIETTDGNHIIENILNGTQLDVTNYLSLGLGIVPDESTPSEGEITVSSSDPLERLFTNDYAYSAKEVKPGVVIGQFDKNAFGFEVVLEGAWKQPRLSIARNVNVNQGNRLTISSGSDSQVKAYRETILNYLDPVCLWSLTYRQGVRTDKGKRKKDDLYNDLISLYLNKNKVYLDIRNENNLSLNFYNDYANLGLKNGTTGSFTPKEYNSNSWPIHELDNSNIDLTPANNKTLISLSLPIGTNSLNVCFLYHATLMRRERFEFLNRWPYWPKNESRFIDLEPSSEEPLFSEFIELSTFTTPNGAAPVATYFRLFYARQKENKDDVIGPRLAANHSLDNLFMIRQKDDLLAVKGSNNMRAWLDGNMRYIPRASREGAMLAIQHSGMYKTGIGMDDDTITFFAVPFAIRGKKKFPRISVGLPASQNQSLLNTIAGENKDLNISLADITLANAEEEMLKVINVYSRPQTKKDNTDANAFLGMCMSFSQYENEILELQSAFHEDSHPVFLQGVTVAPEEVTADSPAINQLKIRLAGLKTTGDVHFEIANLELFGLAINGESFFNTDLAGSFVQAPLLKNTFKIDIGHNPYASSIEREKFDEIRTALVLVHDFLPEEFEEIQALISNGKNDLLPGLRQLEEGTIKVIEPQNILRNYTLSIEYASGLEETAYGEASGEAAYTRQKITVQNSEPTEIRPSTYQILKPDDESYPPLLPIKQTYEAFALDNTYTPEMIATHFQPTLFIYSEDENNFIEVPINQEPVVNSGRAIIDTATAIKLNERIRQSGNSQFKSNEPIKVGATNPLGQTTQRNFKDRFEGVSKRSLALASIIAHELGHILYAINNPLSEFAWGLLEMQYDLSDNRTDPQSISFPSFTGGGHLEGNPTGNLSARLEFEFGKNCIENALWKEGERIIAKYGAEIYNNFDVRYLKTDVYPSAFILEQDTQTLIWNFVVSPYLAGNLGLNDSEIPTSFPNA